MESDKPFKTLYVPPVRKKQAPKRSLIFPEKVMTVQEIKNFVMLDEIFGNKYSTQELIQMAKKQGVKVLDSRKKVSAVDVLNQPISFLNMSEGLQANAVSHMKIGGMSW